MDFSALLPVCLLFVSLCAYQLVLWEPEPEYIRATEPFTTRPQFFETHFSMACAGGASVACWDLG